MKGDLRDLHIKTALTASEKEGRVQQPAAHKQGGFLGAAGRLAEASQSSSLCKSGLGWWNWPICDGLHSEERCCGWTRATL